MAIQITKPLTGNKTTSSSSPWPTAISMPTPAEALMFCLGNTPLDDKGFRNLVASTTFLAKSVSEYYALVNSSRTQIPQFSSINPNQPATMTSDVPTDGPMSKDPVCMVARKRPIKQPVARNTARIERPKHNGAAVLLERGKENHVKHVKFDCNALIPTAHRLVDRPKSVEQAAGGPFMCPVLGCGRLFSIWDDLLRHMKDISKEGMCHTCNYKVKTLDRAAITGDICQCIHNKDLSHALGDHDDGAAASSEDYKGSKIIVWKLGSPAKAQTSRSAVKVCRWDPRTLDYEYDAATPRPISDHDPLKGKAGAAAEGQGLMAQGRQREPSISKAPARLGLESGQDNVTQHTVATPKLKLCDACVHQASEVDGNNVISPQIASRTVFSVRSDVPIHKGSSQLSPLELEEDRLILTLRRCHHESSAT